MRILRHRLTKFISSGLLALSFVAVGMTANPLPASAQAYPADAFVMEIDTTKVSSSNTTFVIPTLDGDYNYTVDCDDAGQMEAASSQTGDYTCEYTSPGTYTVVITEAFPQIQFGKYLEAPISSSSNAAQLLNIKQWGLQQWRSMEKAFQNTQNMQITAIDEPNLSNVTNMSHMFYGSNFNSDISNWNTGSVTIMKSMFEFSAFNQPLNSWDTSNVTDMSSMFRGSGTFNQPLNSWDTSNVTDMSSMFESTQPFSVNGFDQTLASWNISSLQSASNMLTYTKLSPQNYDDTLQAWARQTVQPNVTLGAHRLFYCTADSHNTLTSSPGNWTIEGDTYCNDYPDPTINGSSPNSVNLGTSLGEFIEIEIHGSNLRHSTVKLGIHATETIDNEDSMVRVRVARSVFESPESYDLTLTNVSGKSTVLEDGFRSFKPKVTSANIPDENDPMIMTINGTDFFGGETETYHATELIMFDDLRLLSINGIDVKACLKGSYFEPYGTEALEYYPGLTDSLPCYLFMGPQFESLLSLTELRVLVPENYTSEPITVVVNGSDPFTHNAGNAPLPTKTAQSLAPVSSTVAVAAPLRTATLGVSNADNYSGCTDIDASKTELLAPSNVTAPEAITILGGVGFELDCLEPGDSTMVSLRLGTQYPDTSVLSAYKELSSDDTLTPVDVTFTNRDGATHVNFPLTDGLTDTATGLVDEDGAKDGRIVDPLYIGVSATAQTPAIPGGATNPGTGSTPGQNSAERIIPGLPNTAGVLQQVAETVKSSGWIGVAAASLLALLAASGLYIGIQYLLKRRVRFTS